MLRTELEPLLAKLVALESASPDFLDQDDGRYVTCYRRNPDGPEAVTTIESLLIRIEDLTEALGEAREAIMLAAKDTLWCSDKWPAETVVDHIDAALTQSQESNNGEATNETVVELLPCRECEADCSEQTFRGPHIQGHANVWVCSNHKLLGGDCEAAVAYLSAKDWNTRPSQPPVMDVEREQGVGASLRETGSKAAPEAPAGLRPTGYDPARIKAACRALDVEMDKPIGSDWDGHVRRCVAVVAEALK